jgi:YegS/Rv2252/BmrU family lipid kinase
MRKRTADLVINSREGRNVEKLLNILAVLAAGGYKTRIALKEYGGHSQELARRAAEDGADLVIAYGGDGTLNQVVNGVMNAGGTSTVGVLPGGTANLWATEMGVPTDDPVKAALTLLDSEARRVDVGHVDVEEISLPELIQSGKAKQRKRQKKAVPRSHFLLMAGLGLDAQVMQGVSKPLKYKIKQLAVGLSAAKELPSYRPFPLEIRNADHNLLWQGEAIQVIVGNTRLYADILHMTPEAYIDDGKLDVCVITSGDFVGTLQQIFSLLLRHQPDNVTAEYFRDSRLFLKVPAHVGLQFDGSAVDLTDFLRKAQKKALKSALAFEEISVCYSFEALPRALRVAVPYSYDDALFEENGAVQGSKSADSLDSAISATSAQPEGQEQSGDGAQKFPELLAELREKGRKVSVVDARRDVRHGTYVIAGSYTQAATGAAKPAAVCVDDSTTVLNQNGEKLPPSAVQQHGGNHEITVSGKKNKRGVIRAKYVVI